MHRIYQPREENWIGLRQLGTAGLVGVLKARAACSYLCSEQVRWAGVGARREVLAERMVGPYEGSLLTNI